MKYLVSFMLVVSFGAAMELPVLRSAEAYSVLAYCDEDWARHPIKKNPSEVNSNNNDWWYNAAGSPAVESEVMSTFSVALADWNGANDSYSNWEFNTSVVTTSAQSDRCDQYHDLYWYEEDGTALAQALPCGGGDYQGNGADVRFNSHYDWHFGSSQAPSDKYSYISVARHELGHIQGAAHASSSTSVMRSGISPGEMKIITVGDQALSAFLYGAKIEVNQPSGPSELIAGEPGAFRLEAEVNGQIGLSSSITYLDVTFEGAESVEVLGASGLWDEVDVVPPGNAIYTYNGDITAASDYLVSAYRNSTVDGTYWVDVQVIPSSDSSSVRVWYRAHIANEGASNEPSNGEDSAGPSCSESYGLKGFGDLHPMIAPRDQSNFPAFNVDIPVQQPERTLSVNASGASNVSIDGDPSSASGTTNYTEIVPNGTVVDLTAPSSVGNADFSHWSGCDSTGGGGNRTCTVSMNQDRSVTANFETPDWTLSVSSSGASNVSISGDPSSASGTTDYAGSFSNGTDVDLTAPSSVGNADFSHWSGCGSTGGSGNRTCTVSMTQDRSVTAHYEIPDWTLSVNSSGANNVSISGDPASTSGTTDYAESVPNGTTVQLTAPSSSDGADFSSWSGCASTGGSGNRTCTVEMTTDRSVTVNYAEPDSPDLVVLNPDVSDSSLTPGQSFTLSATVQNQGDADSASTTLRYYRSADSTISPSDTEVGTDPVSGLPAGGSADESIDLAAPSTPDTYYYGACVEAVSGESSTANNCSTGVQVIVSDTSAPDLVVQNPEVDDATLTPGQAFTFSASVYNQGDANASGTTLRYYRSSDSTISGSDTQVGTDSVPGLSVEQGVTESIGLSAPSTPGTYFYGACVDGVDGESSTSNNCSAGVAVSVDESALPDLVPEDFSVSDGTADPGQALSVSVSVQNQGDASASPTTLRYYRSVDSVISAADMEVGTEDISGLEAGDVTMHSTDVIAPLQTGATYFGACVDPVDGESSTSNNCSSAVLVVVQSPSDPGVLFQDRFDQAAQVPTPGEPFSDCSECPTMVAIPAGSFTMGSPPEEPESYSAERPQRTVNVPAFAIGRYEVTFDEWDACVSQGGCSHYPDDEGWGRGDWPVTNISWNDAQEYVAWLSATTGENYRLPSEAEWEYATRAGTTGRFSTGDCISTDQANFNGNYPALGCEGGAFRQKTLPVGSFAPNAFGLYDTHGNLWEPVQDCWNDNYEGAPTDGSAWMSGECNRVVHRGGSWLNFGGNSLRSAFRGWAGSRDNRSYNSGLRVVRSVSP